MADDDDLSAGELEALIASQMALMDETDDTDMFSMEIPHSSHEDEADEGGMDDLFGELMESNKRTEVEDIGLEDVGGWQAPDGSVGVVEATAAPVVVCEESLAKYSKPAAVLPEIRLVMGLLVDAVEEGQTSSMERSASQALMSIDMAVVQAAADSAKADYKLFDESRFDVAAAVAVEKSPDDTAIELVVNNFFGADDMMRKEEARKQDVAKALGEVEGPLNMRDDEHELMIEEERKRRQERKKRREAEAARYRRIRSAVMMQRVLRGCMGRARVGVMIDDKLAAEAERLAEEAARDEMQTAELRCWTAWDPRSAKRGSSLSRSRGGGLALHRTCSEGRG